MRKLIVLAAMLAMVLVAAAPAFAQTAVNDSVAIDNSDSTEYNAFSQNVIGSIETGDATQNGDATATATDDSVAVASVDADLDTSVDVVNHVGGVSFGEFDGWYSHWDHDGFVDDADLDGILDAFDVVILYGDWNNDGFVG